MGKGFNHLFVYGFCSKVDGKERINNQILMKYFDFFKRPFSPSFLVNYFSFPFSFGVNPNRTIVFSSISNSTRYMKITFFYSPFFSLSLVSFPFLFLPFLQSKWCLNDMFSFTLITLINNLCTKRRTIKKKSKSYIY